MTPFPSDDGDRIVPRYRHNQLDALARMFGTPDPLPKRRECGSTVSFDVSWCHQRTRYQLRKLSDEQFADYERRNKAAQQWVGSHVRHFDHPFSCWTADDIDSVVADMVATLRQCPESPASAIDRRTYVRVNRFNPLNGRRDRFSIYVHVGGREYGAEVDLNVELPRRAITTWLSALDPYGLTISERQHGVAISLEEHKSALWTPGAPDPDPGGAHTPAGVTAAGLAAQTLADMNADDDETDDDLDAIEKAARRRLHGEKNIPNTARLTRPQSGGALGEASLRATICAAAYRLSGAPLRTLAYWADRFMKAEDR
jgi:hypothetical protein